MTVQDLIKELSQYDPNDKVVYAYLTYKGRKRKKRTGHNGK